VAAKLLTPSASLALWSSTSRTGVPLWGLIFLINLGDRCHRRAVQIADARAPGSIDCRRPVVEMALFMPFSPSSAPQQMGSWKFLASRSSSRTQTTSSSFLCPQKYRQHSSLVGFGYYGHTTDQACITGSSNRSCNTRTRSYCFRSAVFFLHKLSGNCSRFGSTRAKMKRERERERESMQSYFLRYEK
jgi:hypothetical protein